MPEWQEILIHFGRVIKRENRPARVKIGRPGNRGSVGFIIAEINSRT